MKWLVTYPEDGPSVDFYLNWLKGGGVVPTLVSSDYPRPGSITEFDALLLPGGGDVDPELYGDERHPRTDGVNRQRDDLELLLIREFIKADKPVFGICRGIQILNIAFRGGLIQHVPDFLGPDSDELHSKKGSYDSRHPLSVYTETRLGGAMKEVHEVNSSHHQAIHPDRVGRGLKIAARSGSGVIEAMECFDHDAPIAAVQWHPERLPKDHPGSGKLLATWIQWARRKQ